ncbi:MAG TPA: glycosyltransferase, partial [Thermoanaerobaculia bacterium]
MSQSAKELTAESSPRATHYDRSVSGPFRPCALVPAYQSESTVGEVVVGLRQSVSRVLVVDDGSSDQTSAEAERAGAEVLRMSANLGKGAALRAGLARILSSDATHVAFVDA